MATLKSIFAVALLSPLTLNVLAGDCPALSGEYKIGKTDADYISIGAAVSALQCGGVSGSVTFLIQDGKYNERVDLGSINGASAANKISFESLKGSNTDVILASNTPDADWTVRLNGASFVSFEGLTIENKTGNTGNALRLDGASKNILFKNVSFDGTDKQTTGANNAVIYSTSNQAKQNISFEDCEINNGSFGLFKGGASESDSRTSLVGCIFFNQYESAISLTNEVSPVLSNNVVSSVSPYKSFKGIALENVSGSMIISSNVVNAVNGTYGLAMNNCEGLVTNYGSITNNSLNVGGENTMYGLYLTGKTDNQVLNFNRVKLTPNKVSASNQAYYKNIGSGFNINLLNNIFFDLNTGGYTILGNTYKDFFNQLPSQSNPSLNVSANGIMIEKVTPAN